MQDRTDVVIIWVDGNDKAWIKQKNEYKGLLTEEEDDRDHRYRDWDNLRYWFRGIEKFCPWAGTVHFVTWGHLPEWLDTDNPRLNVVKHEDYIPEKYLPTFSSHTIELNLHRIEELSEKFVYFNDDMFVIGPTTAEDFFKGGKPCDTAIINAHCYDMDDMKVMALFRNIGVINHEFNMRKVVKSNLKGWFNLKYGLGGNFKNAFFLSYPRFPGMLQQHLPNSFCKKTFTKIWDKYPEILDTTCSHKFREMTDVNQWLMKEWQIAEGNFAPRSPKIGKSFSAKNINDVCQCISKQEVKMICLNDVEMDNDKFMRDKEKVIRAFESILPERSSFEK